MGSLYGGAGGVPSPVAQRFLRDFALAAQHLTRTLGLEPIDERPASGS